MKTQTVTPSTDFEQQAQLNRDGCMILRGAIVSTWLGELRQAFDEGVKPASEWPVPRGADWRHALVDLSQVVQSVCCLPQLLAAVGALIGEQFFLSQVEGREPLQGGGHQGLHRDLSAGRPGDTVLAIAFLDDYGVDNGATRIVPGSHRQTALDLIALEAKRETSGSPVIQISGCAGDILVFDADLVHAGSLNVTGARRRSLLITYFAEPLFAAHLQSAQIRGIRMQARWFEPNLA
jgi:ectoine hydroxylase-related dioxygenase (phytanoyl-CoA dioxygenase family)